MGFKDQSGKSCLGQFISVSDCASRPVPHTTLVSSIRTAKPGTPLNGGRDRGTQRRERIDLTRIRGSYRVPPGRGK